MAHSSSPISGFIQQLREHPSDALQGRSQAVHELASLGARAIGPVLEAMEPPYPPGQHPVDVIESLAAVLYVIAKQDPGPLIDVLKQGTAAPDPQLCFVVSALGVAPVGQVLAPLSQALKHPDKQVRWSAARALVKLRTKKAIGPLVEGIGDRSTAVKFVVVEAMHSSKFFRTSKAIGPLERIIESRSIERRAPGLWRYANEVLAMLDSQD